MKVLECEGCGGALAYHPEREQTQCLFCGGVSLRLRDAAVAEAVPTEAVAWGVQSAEAEGLFRTWARSSWWHPRELRALRVTVEQLWIPAWRVDADVELHWAGLRRAATRSGVEPMQGRESQRRGAWIPASVGLRRDELEALAPFPEDACVSWTADDPIAHEVLGLSSGGAVEEARPVLIAQAKAAVSAEHSVRRTGAVAILEDVQTRSLMLPVYIGCFRFRDRPWRFVINGQTGSVVGKGPLDRRKVALVAAVALIVAALVLLRSSHLI